MLIADEQDEKIERNVCGCDALGGRDFNCPVQVQYVNPGSLAERCGMQTNDYILRIGPVSTEHLLHQEVQEQIRRQNNVLEFVLQRLVPSHERRTFDACRFVEVLLPAAVTTAAVSITQLRNPCILLSRPQPTNNRHHHHHQDRRYSKD